MAGDFCDVCAVLLPVWMAAQPAAGWKRGRRDSYIDPRLVALYLALVANRLVPLGGFVCDHVDGTASFAAKGRKAKHTKGAEAGERYYGMAYVKTFLDGLSGYSRVWRVMAPQYDPDWYTEPSCVRCAIWRTT